MPAQAPSQLPRTFDVSAFVLNSTARALTPSSFVTIEADGIILTSQGANPSIGPATVYPLDPAAEYVVTVQFEVLEIAGEPVSDVLAWLVDDAGNVLAPDAFRAGFRAAAPKSLGPKTISVSFAASPEEGSRTVNLGDTTGAAGLRFTSNPARSGVGTRVKVKSMSVEVVPRAG